MIQGFLSERSRRRWPFAALGLALLVGIGELLVWQFDMNRQAETEKRLLSRLVDARALLDAEVGEGIYVTIGLESFIQSQEGQPDFDQIQRWMESLFGHARHLRNIGIAPDNTITAVFPEEGNQDVIGVNYQDLPNQWGEVQDMMQSGDAILVGPIDLIQGDTGLIYRRPVFVQGEYWGLISTVMKFSSITDVIERFADSHAAQYRLATITPEGSETIAGKPTPSRAVSQSLTIDLPGAQQWQMTMSEQLDSSTLWVLRGLLWGVGLVLALAFWQWLRSSQIAREAEARSVQERTDFIHSVSHELRTPLTSIRGAIGLLEQEKSESPRQASLLSLASRNLARLQRLVDEVLDLVRLDASRMELHLEPVKLADLIRQAAENNEYYASQHELELLTRIDADAEGASVDVDCERFLQVMDNLLSNAIKFSDPGQTIELHVARAQNGVEVRVVDQGAGIPESFKPRIFDRFARADSSDRRRNQSGTGLGLSIVRELVQAMQGDVDVDSEEGVGTRFTIHLPLSQP